jgi:D-aminoacyl-tRNA deacylase
MKCVIQLCEQAHLTVANQTKAEIHQGMVIFLGFSTRDHVTILHHMVEKILSLRIFPDATGKTNLSVSDTQGEILWVPNFTLYGDVKHQRRPSFTAAAKPEIAKSLFTTLHQMLQTRYPKSEFGIFGADMSVIVHNRGPFTLTLDSDDYESKT